MHKAIIVHIPDRTDQIIKDASSFILLQIFILHDIIEELLPGAQLSSNIDKMIVLEVFVHLHYVGMVLRWDKNIPIYEGC